jgi:CTP synthase
MLDILWGMKMKIIFVASDFSGLGKGTFAASIGRVLKSHSIETRIMKNDLYFNYDAGTINPEEHGEVYVLSDGTEVDQDFGIYERFLNMDSINSEYLTSGRLFHEIYLNERAGKYLGQTVSIEHIIAELKKRIMDFANTCEVSIVELGATIGDIKGSYLLEACRQIMVEQGPKNTTFILLSYIPYLPNVGELKTMGCQRNVNILRGKGIKPDILIARTSYHEVLPEYQKNKIQLYCDIPKENIYCFPDLEDFYQLPRRIKFHMIHEVISNKMIFSLGPDTLENWYKEYFNESLDLSIAIVGKYSHKDAYISIINQLKMFGVNQVYTLKESENNFDDYDAVILPGGWGCRGVEEIIQTAKICRENRIPCLGICLGLQVMAIEYARNVLNFKDANSIEFNFLTKDPVVTLQEEQKNKSNLGGTSRLGDWTTTLKDNSKILNIYRNKKIIQRHRHRFEISSNYNFKDFEITGRDDKTNLIEVMELRDHPFYIGVQFHPEFSSGRNPIFKALINTALKNYDRV